MENFLDRLRTLDLAILDRIFTPVAHWVHDTFDLRSYRLSGISLVGGGVALSISTRPLFESCFAWLCLATLVSKHVFARKPHKLGMVNTNRWADQNYRICWLMLSGFIATPPRSVEYALWWSSIASNYYFAAVTDRPRRPRERAFPNAVGSTA